MAGEADVHHAPAPRQAEGRLASAEAAADSLPPRLRRHPSRAAIFHAVGTQKGKCSGSGG